MQLQIQNYRYGTSQPDPDVMIFNKVNILVLVLDSYLIEYINILQTLFKIYSTKLYSVFEI